MSAKPPEATLVSEYLRSAIGEIADLIFRWHHQHHHYFSLNYPQIKVYIPNLPLTNVLCSFFFTRPRYSTDKPCENQIR
jgi:hypothetical protein